MTVAPRSAPRLPESTRPGPRTIPAVGFVSTYPPTQCGIATFCASLREAMRPRRSGVVASVEAPGTVDFGPEVVAELVRGSRPSRVDAAAALATFDTAIVQHEFGIYGGPDGDEILELVDMVRVPILVVLHTVLRSPSPRQRAIVELLAAEAATVVVQSEAARSRLVETHEVDPEAVHVIQHGATPNLGPAPKHHSPRRPLLLSWGLLSRDKGLEYAIQAIAALRHLEPRYVIHGRTHPRVASEEGEAYRRSLVEQAQALGVGHLVEFHDRYADRASLLDCIREADVVVMPYRSRDQVVSGVLVEAIASGKPVVATSFPHAVELLSTGSGIVVPHDDPAALAAALERLLTDPHAAARARAAARRQAPHLAWETAGRAYTRLCARIARPAGAVP